MIAADQPFKTAAGHERNSRMKTKNERNMLRWGKDPAEAERMTAHFAVSVSYPS
jgi:hypothetical protein